MNPAAILALIGDLYAQVADLQAEVNRLRATATQSHQDGDAGGLLDNTTQ